MTRSISARRALCGVLVIAGAFAAVLLLTPRASAAGTQVLRLSAKPHMVLRFSTNHLKAHRGRVKLVMHNPRNAGMAHGIAISGHGIHKVGKIVGPGHTSTVTVMIKKKGKYTFFCPVPGHEQAGMKGTLAVS